MILLFSNKIFYTHTISIKYKYSTNIINFHPVIYIFKFKHYVIPLFTVHVLANFGTTFVKSVAFW